MLNQLKSICRGFCGSYISSFRFIGLVFICATILLLNSTELAQASIPGTIFSYQKISDVEGGFFGILGNADNFGAALTPIGDLDGDTVSDLAVGAPGDDDGGTDRGAVWILFMNTNGMVKSHQKISDTDGNFSGILDDMDYFGVSVTELGSLDSDTIPDLAIGASYDDDGGSNRGAVWILFMNANGTVKSHQKISDTSGNFLGVLDNSDHFGNSVTSLNDLDNDNVPDLAVGAYQDDDGGAERGAIWILFMNVDGTVKSHQKISDTEGTFAGVLDNTDVFGNALTALDLDGDKVVELVAGAAGDDDGGAERGAVWVLKFSQLVHLPIVLKN